MVKRVFSLIGAILVYTILIGIVVAIMVMYHWSPIDFVVHTVSRIANFFLSMPWFKSIFG